MNSFQSKSHFSFIVCVLITLLAFSSPPLQAVESNVEEVNVNVFNAFTNAPLTNLRVDAYEQVSEEEFQWRARGNTDDQGQVNFTLEGLSVGKIYYLRAKPYPSGNVYSSAITAAGQFDFSVGSLEIQVKDYMTQAAMIDHRVTLYERLDDGGQQWAASGKTDENGLIQFTPQEFEEGRRYFVKTGSYNSGNIYSAEFSSASQYVFEIGSVKLTVEDYFSGSALADSKVYLYKRLADGSEQWAAQGYTDENGSILFTPTELDSGQVYFAKIKPYNTDYAYSQDITEKGALTFNVGALKVNLKDHFSQTAFADTKVYLYQLLDDGSEQWAANGYTDANGQIRFSPYELGQGRRYIVKSKPYRSGYVVSEVIDAPTDIDLNAGTVKVQVVDFQTQDPLTELKVYLYQKQADGSEKWAANGYTDNQGIIYFTPQGLTESVEYIVKTNPYDSGYAYSNIISAAQEVQLNVGTLTVNVLDHFNQTPLQNGKVYLYKRLADGSGEWTAKAYTDDQGKVRFTPPGLESGEAYFVKTKPYNSDYAFSDDTIEPGNIDLSVGALNVTLVDYLSQSTIADSKISLYHRQADGKLKWAGQGYSDAQGNVKFSPPGIFSGESYVLKTTPFSDIDAYSRDLSAPVQMDFEVGALQVKIEDYWKNTPLTGLKVHLYEKSADGSEQWQAKGNTDEQGLLRFSPMGLGDDKTYFLKTEPFDAGYAYSSEISAKGEMTLPVGTLDVVLTNYISKQALIETRLDLYEMLADGTKKWRARGNTDNQGKVRFTPYELGQGRQYIVKAKPYNGGNVYSMNLSDPQQLNMEVGSSPVTLINGDTGAAMADHKMTVYRKLADGKKEWVKSGTSNEQGVVHFDLDFMNGETYVFYVKNAFGQNKKYYSQVVTEKGAVEFIITVDGDNELDATPPEISISSPADGANVTLDGFSVTGLASDNKTVDSVIIVINDPIKGSTQQTANYDAVAQSWTAQISAADISLNQQIAITATATDLSQNQQSASISVFVAEDIEGPEIVIDSHLENDEVSETGFLLSGLATDQTGVESLTATLSIIQPGNQLLFSNRAVSVADNGRWTLVLDNKLFNADDVINIALTAEDSANNIGQAEINLNVVAVNYSGLQLINRITFGATPALSAEVEAIGVTDFLTQQLNPDSIDDSEFNAMLGGSLPQSKGELQAWTLMHMIYSKKQLQEVMTWFWDNHFNTDINTERNDANDQELSNTTAYELAENQAFRANALGNFRVLLGISAKSPAMLIYLDSISNVINDSNENYAREVLELHTMGVEGGYTSDDVEAGAEIFTGWHVQNGAFFFDSNQHNSEAQNILSATIPGGIDISSGGVNQGEAFLDAIAEHQSTAEFICSKLVAVFVSDETPDSLVTRCAGSFLANSTDNDQIKTVLTTILDSAEFYDSAHYRNKIKTPLEFVVGAVRNLQASSDATDLIAPIRAMGIRLYENPVPTGWAETGSEWINSSLLIERIKWVNDYVRNPTGSNATHTDPVTFYSDHQQLTAEGITGFLLGLTVGDDVTDLSRNTALQILGDEFNIAGPDAEAQLRRLNGSVLSFPQYQYQ